MTKTRLQGEGFMLEIERHPHYLRASVSDGVDSLAVSIAMWTMLAGQCLLHGARRLLVVESLDGVLAPDEFPQLIDAITGLGFEDIRIAFVALQPDGGANEHCEILALERGIDVLVCASEMVARNWLLFGGEAAA